MTETGGRSGGSVRGERGRRAGRWSAPLAVMALLLTAVPAASAGSAKASAHEDLAPLHRARRTAVAHHYLVVLKARLPQHPTTRSERRARAVDERVAASVGATPDVDYVADLEGFSARLSRHQLRQLRRSPRVAYVEQVERVHEDTTQSNAPWGLDRIDQQALPLDSSFTYTSQGAGVHVYVVDTGIEIQHTDFGGRAQHGSDSTGATPAQTDCNGHGTHVAGIAGGTTYGVAKRATLVSVRVLNCGGSGTSAGVIAGLDWIAAHRAPRSVVNMSLGGGSSPTIDAAVTRLIDAGAFVVAAAGNDNRNACNTSPARVPAAFTVAATDSSDRKASFSNHGSCVDAYAPGVAITSDWIGATTKTISGTSMAAPAVAGIAALYLADHHAAMPGDITQWLTSRATTGVVGGNPADTPNRLVFTGGL